VRWNSKFKKSPAHPAKKQEWGDRDNPGRDGKLGESLEPNLTRCVTGSQLEKKLTLAEGTTPKTKLDCRSKHPVLMY